MRCIDNNHNHYYTLLITHESFPTRNDNHQVISWLWSSSYRISLNMGVANLRGLLSTKNRHGWQAFVCEWCNKCQTTIQGVVAIGCDGCSLHSLSLFYFVYSYYVALGENLKVKSWERVSRSQWLLDKLCIKTKYGSYVPKWCHFIFSHTLDLAFSLTTSSIWWYFMLKEIVGELFGNSSSLLRQWRVGWSVGEEDPLQQPMDMLARSNVEHRQDQNFAGMQSNLNMDSDWNMIDTPISDLPPVGPLASGAITALDQHQSSSSCQKNINVDGNDLKDLDNEDQSYVTKVGSRGSIRPRTGVKRDRY